jgi:hypothetical protein
VEVETAGRVQRRIVSPTRSYLSQCDRSLRIGVGDATAVDRVTIWWPSGARQDLPAGMPMNQVHRIEQPR